MNAERKVWVCQYRICLGQGSDRVLAEFQAQTIPGVMVSGCGCQGQCSTGPTVRIFPDETWYCRVRPEQVADIVQQHLQAGQPVQALLNPRIHAQFYY